MIRLRNGQIAEDPRLDRLVWFDEQSRSYPVLAALPAEAAQRGPRPYTWRCRTWLDQGREGACTAFAFAHDAAARPAEVKAMDESETTQRWILARYHDAQHQDPWDGCSLGPRCPIEPRRKRYDGSAVLAAAKVFQSVRLFREYRWAFGEDDLRLSLGYEGPAVIGVNWYEGMGSPNPSGFIHSTGRRLGGHAILVNGLHRDADGTFYYRLRNSWGHDWGKEGDCFVTAKDMARLLTEDGECVFPVGRRVPRGSLPNPTI